MDIEVRWLCYAAFLVSCGGESPSELPAGSSAPTTIPDDSPALPAPADPPERWVEPEPIATTEDVQDEDVEHLSLQIDACGAADCPLVLRFSAAMVEGDELAEADLPKVSLTPAITGTWGWRTSSELVFTPKAEKLLWGNAVEVNVPVLSALDGVTLPMEAPYTESVRVPNLHLNSKVSSHQPVVAGQPRYVGVLNGGAESIGSGPLILAYDQRVSAKRVKETLKATTTAAVAVPIRVYRPESVQQAFSGDLPAYHFVAVKLQDKLENGSEVTLSIPSWTGETADVVEVVELSLNVDTEFEIEEQSVVGKRSGEVIDGPAPLSAEVRVRFSDTFMLENFQRHLKVEPAPKSITVSGHWGGARVSLLLAPGTSYKVSTAREFTDMLGNRLSKPLQIRFKSQDLPPVLVTPQRPTLVESGRASLPVRLRNTWSIRPTLVEFSNPVAFARALNNPSDGPCAAQGAKGERIKLDKVPGPTQINEFSTVSVPIPRTGLFCLEVKAKGRGSEASEALRKGALVQASDLGITAKVSTNRVFVWVTRLGKPAPVAGADVRVLNARGKTVGQGTTNADGVVEIDAMDVASSTGVKGPLAVVAELEDEVAVTLLTHQRLSSAWQFGLKGATNDPLYASVFTERGAYRPGQTVHAKFILGPAPWLSKRQIEAEIRDSRGQRVQRSVLKLDEFGAASLDLKLKKQAPVGSYTLKVNAEGRTTSRHFKVEEYRVPTFQVKVRGRNWAHGDEAQVRLEAKYMHGGALSGRKVRYEVTREPHVFTPGAYPKYVFALGNAAGLSGTVSSGERYLDDKGQQLVRFTPEHPSAAGPMRYSVEASVTDVDRQAYAGRTASVVHPAAFYVGVRPPSRSFINAGDVLVVPVAAVSPSGLAVAGVQVRARLERIDHHTSARVTQAQAGSGSEEQVQMLNREVEVKQQDCVVITKGAPVLCKFNVENPGQYRVRAWAQDRFQRSVQAGFSIFASGDKPAAWPRFDQDRIAIVADKSIYKPGETAKLIVQSPYENALGLLTVEREGVVSHRVIRIEGDTPTLDVAIEDAHAPNLFVSVALLRGRVHNDSDDTGFETGAPGFKIGYAKLSVEPTKQKLTVTVAPRRKVVTPGSSVMVDVELKDYEGKPTAGQVTLWAVDEAVLGLTNYATPDPTKELYAERALGVRTGESRLELAHAKRARREVLFPGGDGADADPSFSDIAVELRKLFKSTAHWNPTLKVGADGKASAMVELPDNITTYRIMAVAVDLGGRVGSGHDRLLVKRPLIVQPVLPRFVYPGDTFTVEALAFNGTAKFGEVTLAAEFEGLTLTGGKLGQRQNVEAGGQGSFSFPVRIDDAGAEPTPVKIRFAAKMGDHTDAVEVTVPVLLAGTKRLLVASRNVSGTGELSISIPADRIAGTTKMEIVASTTSLTELKDAVQYLMRYPNGCIEQTTSTAYPLVVLKDLLPEMGIEVDMEALAKYTDAGIRRIMSFQTEGGGLSYWPGGTKPHAFATSFGLTALIEAKNRGYDIPQEALDRMADFLEATLRKGKIQEKIAHGGMADGDSRALFVMTLGRLGRAQAGYVSKLWEQRKQLSAFGLSFLGIAASELPGESSLLKPILAAVQDAAKQEAQQAWFEGEPKGGWSFDSPLRTHAVALLAHASTDGGDMTGKLLAGLLKRRRNGLWGNTQENVFGIMGIHRLAGSKSSGSAPNLNLTINGAGISEDDMEKVSRRVRRVSLLEGQLGLKPGEASTPTVTLSNNGGKPIILTLRGEYEVPLSDENRAPLSHGFVMRRTYETLEGENLEGKPIALGSLVRVRLRVKSENKLNYVAIDDKLPAGLEPLNTTLETTERVSLGALSTIAKKSLGLLSYQEIRDHRVAFFVDEMPAGDYEYAFIARATTPGKFLRPAGRSEAMYKTEVYGTTSIDYVVIE